MSLFHINPFTRREVMTTYDSAFLQRATGALTAAGIDYSIRTNSLMNPGRQHGAPFIRQEHSYQYRLYVHKSDYDRAGFAMRNIYQENRE